MYFNCKSIAVLLFITSASTGFTTAQDAELAANQSLQALYRAESQKLEFGFAGEGSTKISVQDKPAMTWSSIGGWSGGVFVWTGMGRIQAVGCIGSHEFRDGQYQVFYEFHSLNEESLQPVKLGSLYSWEPPPVKRKPFLRGPTPAKTKSLRLVQMRNLARTFKVGMQVDQDNVENELRLLPQPVARESSTSNDIVDSALFAYVSSSGTDPEAFLLLEARKDGGGLVWEYAIVRFTTRKIWYSPGAIDVVIQLNEAPWSGTTKIKASYFFRNSSVITDEELASIAEK